MATLEKNGEELYRFLTLTSNYSIRSNGHILQNRGTGWKRWKKIKENPREYAERLKEKHRLLDEKNPKYVEFRETFHRIIPFKLRNLVYISIQMLPDDPDGLWSSLEDYGIHLSVEECVKLCDLYNKANQY